MGSGNGHAPGAIENALDSFAKTQLVSRGHIPKAQSDSHDNPLMWCEEVSWLGTFSVAASPDPGKEKRSSLLTGCWRLPEGDARGIV
jgi:hypothetical protein